MYRFLVIFLLIQSVTFTQDNKLHSFPISSEGLPSDLEWQNGMENKTFASPNALKGGTWNRFINRLPPTLREVGPNSNNSFRTELELGNMYLVEVHPENNSYIPGIAKEWAVGNDFKTVYYKIDPDARWSDGKSVTVDDFIFKVKLMRSKNIFAPWNNEYYNSEIDRVLKFDRLTFAIRTKKKTHDPVYHTSLSPKPYHFYGNFVRHNN